MTVGRFDSIDEEIRNYVRPPPPSINFNLFLLFICRTEKHEGLDQMHGWLHRDPHRRLTRVSFQGSAYGRRLFTHPAVVVIYY
jgi:hypothetical protein